MVPRAVIEKPEKVGITHDTAARLIGITPSELSDLVRDGYVHRNDKNSYSVPVLVGEYCAHLRAEMLRPETHPKQAETAAHCDLSDRSIREWEVKLNLQAKPYTRTEFRIAYIRSLRDTAAGRATTGDLDLATERAALARAQREKIEMQNAVTRKELAPAYLLEEILASAGARMGAIFDAIPGAIRRRNQAMTAADIEVIAGEIAKARNIAAALTLDELIDTTALEAAAADPVDLVTE